MAIYAISDLHLALGCDKPMDIFGGRWANYMEKIKNNWQQVVNQEDYVIIPGDVSWATYIENAYEDFSFIEQLPGKKIISKGNHDYWWTTASKLNKYMEQNNFKTISFLHNNAFLIEDVVICGTRGWKCPGDDDFKKDDDKIYKREVERLKLSLRSAEQLAYTKQNKESVEVAAEKIVFIHYPPITQKSPETGFLEVLRDFNVKKCFFGHLHGEGIKGALEGNIFGIEFKLISADYLDFLPVSI